jgi:hypothetical protein
MSGNADRFAASNVLRATVAVVIGSAVQVAVISAGFSWRNWSVSRSVSRITAECEPTDCQPQYYFGLDLEFMLLLPVFFVLGCVATWFIWSIAFRSSADRSRLRQNVALALVPTPIALVALGIWLSARDELHRRPIFVAAFVAVPSLAAATAWVLTSLRRGGRTATHLAT